MKIHKVNYYLIIYDFLIYTNTMFKGNYNTSITL
jgi:hypothetical protein